MEANDNHPSVIGLVASPVTFHKSGVAPRIKSRVQMHKGSVFIYIANVGNWLLIFRTVAVAQNV
jgi:hypothetical protein